MEAQEKWLQETELGSEAARMPYRRSGREGGDVPGREWLVWLKAGRRGTPGPGR